MAGSRPSAAELAAIPRLGEVAPRIVTGAKTPAAKREAMQRDIAISEQGQRIKRNKRAIARDAATNGDVVDAETQWRDGLSFSALNKTLVDFIKRADWWSSLSEPTQEGLIDLYWRQYAKGRLSMRAWLLEVENVKLELGLKTRSIEAQREKTIRQQ